jgi:hypothetical protein
MSTTKTKTETKGAQHTPGPWTANEVWKRYAMQEWAVNVTASPTENATKLKLPNQCAAIANGFTKAEAEANARLIAAAPELLAELRRGVALAVAAIRAMPATTEPNAVELAMWAGNGGPARAAIAKATGQE